MVDDTSKTENKCYYDTARDIIDNHYRKGIKTPLQTEMPFIYDKGYYDCAHSIPKLKGIITAKLQEKATKFAVKQILDFIKRLTFVDMDGSYARKYENYVSLENGVLNLKTMEVELPHQAKFVTWRIPVKYDPDIDMKPFNEYINTLAKPEHLMKLQEHVGNIFAPHYLTKKLCFIVGPPDGGKSLFLRVLNNFLGKDNYSTLNLNEIGEKFVSSQLYSKRANICSDVPYKITMKHYSRIKNLTGGDYITIEFKHQNAFSYRPIAKLFFSANGVPMINTDQVDDAFLQRWDFIDFPYSFPKKDMFNDLISDDMKSALLNWALEGYDRLKKNEWILTGEDSIDDVETRFSTSKYAMDDFDVWLTENYKPSLKEWILKSELFRDCKEWHLANDLTSHSYSTDYRVFCRKLKNNKFIKVETFQPRINDKQQTAFIGINRKSGENDV